MKNMKLKGALKQLNALKELKNETELEVLDNQKAAAIKGGTKPTSQTGPIKDSCGSVFSCGLYHVL